jgi:hypothetical protein
MSDEWKDGMPPVGCECEYSLNGMLMPKHLIDWYKCEIKYVVEGEWVVILASHVKGEMIFSGGRLDTIRFRPIQTQADKEREEAINEAKAKFCIGQHDNITIKEMIAAGYRLPVEQGEVVSASEFMDIAVDDAMDEDEWTAYLGRHYIITRKPKS